MSQPLIRDVWGHGFVHIKLLGNLPIGSGEFEEARLTARYLSKYVTKNVGEERVPGLHRYEVAQGFQPEAVPLLGRSMDDLVEQASERTGLEFGQRDQVAGEIRFPTSRERGIGRLDARREGERRDRHQREMSRACFDARP